MLEYVYVCRHGFRSNWVDPTITTGPTGMNRDPPLAAYGLDQASHLASFLLSPSAHPDVPAPTHVFSSAFYRCIETALPTAQALQALGGEVGQGRGMFLEHGAGEWYSPTLPDTGLHPRPAPAHALIPLFPPGAIDPEYSPTVFPSRRGESLTELLDRADLFVEAWTGRVEAEMPDAKAVVIFSHAATAIALGRAFTGNKSLDIPAGVASTSLYRRKAASPSASSSPSTSSPSKDTTASLPPCGVGEWEAVWISRADYLPRGLEMPWTFHESHQDHGEAVLTSGDRGPHPPTDEVPAGLAPGMEKHLRRGLPAPNGRMPEQNRVAHIAQYRGEVLSSP